jgi:hypothetical protein
MFCSRVEGSNVLLAWDPSPSPAAAGYALHYGLASHNYTAMLDAGTNLSITVEGLDEGTNYFFAISSYENDGTESTNSDEISVTAPFADSANDNGGTETTNSGEIGMTIPFPPLIIFEPSAQTAQVGAKVVMSVVAIGTPPVTFQWFNGATPITGGTNSLLTWPHISEANAGDYTVVVNDSDGSVTSAVATVTVIGSPSGMNTISGALGTLLRAENASPSGKLLAVLAAPGLVGSVASAAGTYNGLFYQTNDGGMPALSVETAGLLTNCVVDAEGNYTGAIYVGGLSNFISGAFDASGNGSATVDRTAAGLSDLGVALQLSLTDGEMQMTGIVSNLDQGNPWMSVLTAKLETNAFDQSQNFLLAIPPISGLPGSDITGVGGGGVFSLLGMLGDGTIIWQDAPVSTDGSLPLFIQLYGQSGLLAGWVNVFGNPSTSVLTWICPSGPTTSGFTNIVEATVTPTVAADP